MGTSGRLSLSWINKDRSLISTQDGGYEWVDRDDIRVTETRLLRDVATVGEVHDDLKRAEDNLLISGDSGDALRALTRLPEFADKYRGKVKLAYIDPPFNTGQAFDNYNDGVEHSVWLTMMRDRLLLIRDLLAPDGSIWLHLDDSEGAYARVLMDEIFGRSCFAGTVIWRSTDNSNNDAKTFSVDHNMIHVYGKSPGWLTNRVARREEQSGHYSNPDNDPRGPWFDGNPLGSPNPRKNLQYDIVSPQGHVISSPPNGWRWSRETLEEKMATGEIRFTPDGRGIRRRTYLLEQGGLPPSTLWADIEETGSNRKAKAELKRLFRGTPTSALFKTPKPESLLRKVLEIASQPGDVVFDCFGGSGTTAAVAHKMGRRWILVEREPETVDKFIRPRLDAVVNGEEPGGISKEVGWEKGGGFRHLKVAPSMYERLGNRILLAPWVAGDAFAEAACAQIPGCELEPGSEPPFAGRKGRQRLAVVDGLVSESTVQSIVDGLDDDERVLIVAKSYLREAAGLLADLSPGSRIKKAPQDLLDMKGRVLR
ncbi:site-specific DNA-methyltransferase [Streptomyces sp. PKU-EA00015]|uniref:site-specific DNA-methyltransferase n=1 Tax=Streptomyces sp. PKU-EA00015 TaxID=2748326 RepID=UPI00159FB77C|nr:site-specific DNA-methyltransferase [Streptomyces sp. PKU-EA00015]NWF28288.1 site-specific DNA-methyltransferase [Streptomyces sp. PKU-EA00015]